MNGDSMIYAVFSSMPLDSHLLRDIQRRPDYSSVTLSSPVLPVHWSSCTVSLFLVDRLKFVIAP